MKSVDDKFSSFLPTDKAGPAKDAEVMRDVRQGVAQKAGQSAHTPGAAPQALDDSETNRVGQSFKETSALDRAEGIVHEIELPKTFNIAPLGYVNRVG